MSFLGSKSQIMDDLIFHELWLAKQKFHNYEGEESSEDENERNDDSDFDSDETENESDFKDLFKKDREESRLLNKKKRKIKSRSVAGARTSEWMAAFVGVFFVAAVAGVASYRAYSTDVADQLNKANVMAPFSLQDAPLAPTSMNGANNKREEAALPSSDGKFAPRILNPNTSVPQGMYNEIMLPKTLEPTSYILYLSVHGLDGTGNSSAYNYKAVVRINLKCLEDTDQIVLHSSRTRHTHAEVTEVGKTAPKITDQNKNVIKITKTQYNPQREMVAYSLAKNMTAGKEYSLLIAFRRELTYTDNDGFFLTNYVDGSGKQK